jgi:hypothetical protein
MERGKETTMNDAKTTAGWLCYCGQRNKFGALLCAICDRSIQDANAKTLERMKGQFLALGDPKPIVFIATAIEDAKPGRYFRVRHKTDGYLPICRALMSVRIGDVVAVAPDFSAAPITPEAVEEFLAKKPEAYSIGAPPAGETKLLPGGEKILNQNDATPQLKISPIGKLLKSDSFHRQIQGSLQRCVDKAAAKFLDESKRRCVCDPEKGTLCIVHANRRVAMVGRALEGALAEKRLRVIQVFADHGGRVVTMTANEPIDEGDYVQMLPGNRVKPIDHEGVQEILCPETFRDALVGGKAFLDEASADAFQKLMDEGKIPVRVAADTVELNEDGTTEVHHSPDDFVPIAEHPRCRSSAEIQIGHEGDVVPEDAEIGFAEPRSFRPGLVHEPDPRCDCGGQKGGGRCDSPCPAAVPFRVPIGCADHGIALADMGECGACGASAYCPGCQRCFDCTEPNDDGAHLTPLCESCEKPADFEIHNEDTDGRTVATYACEGHVAGKLPRDQQSDVVPIEVDRSTVRALKARSADTPF